MKETAKIIFSSVIGIVIGWGILAIGFLAFKGAQSIFSSTVIPASESTMLIYETGQYASDAKWLIAVGEISEDEKNALNEALAGKSIKEQHDILEAAIEGKEEIWIEKMNSLNDKIQQALDNKN